MLTLNPHLHKILTTRIQSSVMIFLLVAPTLNTNKSHCIFLSFIEDWEKSNIKFCKWQFSITYLIDEFNSLSEFHNFCPWAFSSSHIVHSIVLYLSKSDSQWHNINFLYIWSFKERQLYMCIIISALIYFM